MAYSPGYYGAWPNYGYPGGSDTIIPLLELSGNLMVAYGRNVKDFAVNRYSKVTPVKATTGTFLQFNPLDLARLTPYASGSSTSVDQGANWAPGTPSPTGFDDTLSWTTATFRCQRKAYAKTLDKRAVDCASFPIMSTHTAALGQKLMSYRAWKTAGVMFNTANYQTTHVSTCTALAGGYSNTGTTYNPVIMNMLNAADRQIQKDTMGAIRYGHLSVLINPDTALQWASTPEIREYVMQQNDSIKNIRMDDANYNGVYGLPSRLYNHNLVVDDTVINTANEGNAAEGGTFVVPDNTALVFLADGDIEVPEGSTSFATCHMFAYEEFNLETKDDPWDRLVAMRAVLDADWQIVSPQSGYVVTDLFS